MLTFTIAETTYNAYLQIAIISIFIQFIVFTKKCFAIYFREVNILPLGSKKKKKTMKTWILNIK